MFLFALLFLLAPALALNVTVCDCGSAESKGFLKFSDEDCDHLQSPTPPVQVHYSVFSTRSCNQIPGTYLFYVGYDQISVPKFLGMGNSLRHASPA